MAVALAATAITSCQSSPPPQGEAAKAAPVKHPPSGPPVVTGGQCPVTRTVTRPTTLTGDLLGDGPARPFMPPTLRYDELGSEFGGDGWGGAKVPWFTQPDITTPITIRGIRLDGEGGVAFRSGGAKAPLDKLVIAPDPTAKDWRDHPGFVLLKTPGCYAFQIDTASSTTYIVFKAEGPVIA
ncbi:hypothetical protein [Sinosporangium siamense]|uniref:Uncharacterized protein n=1 Tax=Sinosporangium siamense TaxID=1367973 RepID=A0A919RGH9_9ACTN|nr:hypothetical protein [Sinosporangium siamense]GII91964.1 hypothetical protein Ssi02_21950 [Sinosporangium siamense]